MGLDNIMGSMVQKKWEAIVSVKLIKLREFREKV
jgi:hypothetical protein